MRSALLLTSAAILSAAILFISAKADSGCEHRSRRPGIQSIIDTNLTDLLGPGYAVAEPACTCIQQYLCNDEESNSIEVDLGKKNTKCEDFMEVCCKTVAQEAATLRPPYVPPRGCGQRNEAGVRMRVIGNIAGEAQFGEFPWTVALLDVKSGVEMFTGGGALIHPSVVLTAAHVVATFAADPTVLRVRVGEWDTQTTSEPLPHQQLSVKEVVKHPRFYPGAHHNNIALLVLRDPALLAENVATLCLPEQNEVIKNAACVATGWGKDKFGSTDCYRSILKSLSLPLVDRSDCQRMLRATRLGPGFRLHPSSLCAGGEHGVDACNGDGGGPLICSTIDRTGEIFYRQVGIISWGIGCGDADIPGVYTNVAMFRPWIDQWFAARGLDGATYRRH